MFEALGGTIGEIEAWTEKFHQLFWLVLKYDICN